MALKVEILKELKAGGYGTVHKVKFQDYILKEGAIKIIKPSPRNGLESIVEVAIMKNINHPNLNRALFTQVQPDGTIFIIQELATGDANELNRATRASRALVKKWFWQTVCGLAQLHIRNILHGDIKGPNILIFGQEAKLNDFSLSRLILNPEIGTRDLKGCFTYTSTHRPLEVWQGCSFSFGSDIWALGCTFYEIFYSKLLFPEQNTVNKSLESYANLQAFEQWSEFMDNPAIQPPRGSSFRSINIVESFFASDSETLNFNNLLFSMLELDIKNRFNVWDVINHKYFDEMRYSHPISIKPEESIPFSIKFQGSFPVCDISDPDVFKVAHLIYLKLKSLKPSDFYTCIVIGYKTLYGITATKSHIPTEIDLLERLDFDFIP